MLSSSWLSVSLSEPKINNIDIMLLFANSNEEVIRFDVSVQEMPGMNVFNSLNHLVSKHEHGLQREFSLAVVEKVLQ